MSTVTAVTVECEFSAANTEQKLFCLMADVPLVDALESAAVLLDSAKREVCTLIEHCSEDKLAGARLQLIKIALEAAEAIAWSASECKALNGGAV